MPTQLAFIGAGNMAEAILRGVLRAGDVQPSNVIAADISSARRDLFASEFGIRTIERPVDAVNEQTSVIMLCVKPQHAGDALNAIANSFPTGALLISIAAGISCTFIESKLASSRVPQPRVVRVMPNTPMLVGAGIAAISAGEFATQDDLAIARKLFESSAKVITLDESRLDAVTAVSGSGPAYFFYLVEQMTAAGIANGLSAEDAATLARETAIGAGQMLAQTSDSPELLRQKVTSPGGTTHAAIERMKSLHFDTTIIDALTVAAKRAAELSRAAK